ncbi:MAG: hypothetical protein P9M11_01545 [Candidatus Tenebribacter burtonii]|nr:hypothetical protein [Candidatus Tenebribacter burtonii]
MKVLQSVCTFTFILAFLIFGCSKNNPTSCDGDIESLIEISFTDDKVMNENNSLEYTYTQGITWEALIEDEPLYAYRITTSNGELPASILTDTDGWVYQNDPQDENTIWTNIRELQMSFNSVNGMLEHIITIFEVKLLIDDKESDVVTASFFDFREIGTILSTTAGDCNGQTTGTGLTFLIREKIQDIFVDGLYADHFMYRVNIISEIDSTIISEGEWFNSINCEDIRKVELTGITIPSLIPNENSELTQFETYIVTRSGYADIDNPAIANFKVQEGFYPGTIIYYGEDNANANGIYALGTHHFATYLDDGISDVLPSVQIFDGTHFATAFWYDSEEKYTAIGSDDFEIFMRWGYNGEFENNNPHKQREDITLDELTGETYFSEIVGYDLRLDGEPYYYPSIPAIGENLQVDIDGTEWLRVSVNDEIGQETILSLTSFNGLLEYMYGEHTFEVRAIDLQGAVDLTPHEFTFTIVPPVPKEEKSGVLILDDEPDYPNISPGELIDTFYEYIVSDYTTEPGYINRDEIQQFWMDGLHYGKSIIAPSDIQQYKTIIYHADNPTAEFNFWKEFESLKIYLLQGGNLILSSGSELKITHNKCSQNNFNIFEQYFGIPMNNEDAIDYVSTSFTDNPFFIQAITEGSYNDIDLLLPSFNVTITNPYAPILSVNGLGPVAYFNDHEAEVIYSYGCKDVGEDPPGCPYHIIPTQEEYDQFNGLPVALRYVTPNNACFLFGFPLAYMEPDQVKSMMTQILNELE